MSEPPEWFKKIYTEAWPKIQAQQRKATTMKRGDERYTDTLERRILGLSIELQLALDATKELSKTIQQKNQRISDQDAKIEDLRKDRHQANTRIEDLDKRLADEQERNEVLEAQNKDLKNTIAKVRADHVETKQSLENDKAIMAQACKDRQEDLADAQQRIRTLEESVSSHQGENTRLDQALHDKAQRNKDLDRNLANHKQTLIERDRDLAEVRQKLHEAEAALQIRDEALGRIEMYALAPIRPERSDQDSVLEYVDEILQRLSNCHEATKRAQLEPIPEPTPDAET